MPLTKIQKDVALLLTQNKKTKRYLAGGSAMHFEPQTYRYSEDLDYFHDSLEEVSKTFDQDKGILQENGYKVKVDILTPAYIRCLVSEKKDSCKVEWARDSSWRFMPIQSHKMLGLVLHPVDLIINKALACVGRDEARDFLDVLQSHKNQLSLGAQCWAACGKDPGFGPHLLLDLLKRKGKYQEEDFRRLHFSKDYKIDLVQIKKDWLEALEQAEIFLSRAPIKEIGCLYYSKSQNKFVTPDFTASQHDDVAPHYGRAGGVLPVLVTDE